MEPGIYHGISMKDYNALPYVRNSYLKKMAKCPANAKVEDEEETKALIFGRAAHALTLEGDAAFAAEFIVVPDDAPKKPTKAQINAKKPSMETLHAIDWWNTFTRISNGKSVITTEDYTTLCGVRNSVRTHPFASLLLKTGVSETTVVFDVEISGQKIRCKVRPDRTPSPDKQCLLDLKTTDDAGYDAFIRSCKKYGYFRQGAMYIDGYNAARELPMKQNASGVWELNKEIEPPPPIMAFAFIAVEKKPPYRCEVYTLGGDNTYLIEGKGEYLKDLQTELECRRNGHWPHYQNAGCQELLPYSERIA